MRLWDTVSEKASKAKQYTQDYLSSGESAGSTDAVTEEQLHSMEGRLNDRIGEVYAEIQEETDDLQNRIDAVESTVQQYHSDADLGNGTPQSGSEESSSTGSDTETQDETRSQGTTAGAADGVSTSAESETGQKTEQKTGSATKQEKEKERSAESENATGPEEPSKTTAETEDSAEHADGPRSTAPDKGVGDDTSAEQNGSSSRSGRGAEDDTGETATSADAEQRRESTNQEPADVDDETINEMLSDLPVRERRQVKHEINDYAHEQLEYGEPRSQQIGTLQDLYDARDEEMAYMTDKEVEERIFDGYINDSTDALTERDHSMLQTFVQERREAQHDADDTENSDDSTGILESIKSYLGFSKEEQDTPGKRFEETKQRVVDLFNEYESRDTCITVQNEVLKPYINDAEPFTGSRYDAVDEIKDHYTDLAYADIAEMSDEHVRRKQFEYRIAERTENMPDIVRSDVSTYVNELRELCQEHIYS